MTVYKGKVTKEFIDRRDSQVAADDRDYDVAMRQWDFEFPEHHQCSIPGGHKLYEGYEYDTTHPFFGNCDFKHVNKNNEFHISPYILKQLQSKKIDHIVTWKYKNKDWSRPLQEGDSVQYEVLEYIPASEVLTSIQEKTEVRGFTVKT
jgi:hypothetical protein